MTNADRIRNMTDEEMAMYIDPSSFDCVDVCDEFECGCAYTCKHNMGKDLLLKWLKAETKEG